MSVSRTVSLKWDGDSFLRMNTIFRMLLIMSVKVFDYTRRLLRSRDQLMMETLSRRNVRSDSLPYVCGNKGSNPRQLIKSCQTHRFKHAGLTSKKIEHRFQMNSNHLSIFNLESPHSTKLNNPLLRWQF